MFYLKELICVGLIKATLRGCFGFFSLTGLVNIFLFFSLPYRAALFPFLKWRLYGATHILAFLCLPYRAGLFCLPTLRGWSFLFANITVSVFMMCLLYRAGLLSILF